MTADNAWEKHRLEQLRRWQRLTHAQRLRWLDEAKAFAAKAKGAVRSRAAVRKKS